MTLRATFDALRAGGELALIPYVTAGFPTLDASLDSVRELAEAGADIIEVGIPFSDPVADGPTIQYASQVALDGGFRLPDLLTALQDVDVTQPLVLMSYLNPLMAMNGEDVFARMAAVGIRGLIVPDLPVEEASEWSSRAKANAIEMVFLAAPTSGESRLRAIAEQSTGFVYFVSVAGITGERAELPAGLCDRIRRFKTLSETPVAVGFGISQAAQIRSLMAVADGVVVGSRIITAIRRGENVGELIRELKSACRSAETC